MVARRLQCDQHRLTALLDDSLAEPDEREALSHLETCPHCRHRLETMAAQPQWWTDAGRLLRPNATDIALSSVGAATAASDDDAVPSADAALSFLDPADSLALMGRLGPYDILEIIGRGGMGLVLKGYDRALDRQVAIKVLAPHLATSGAARRRFAREAQAAAAVVHPHVIAIHAVESTGKLPYLVMPLVVGQSLEERLRTGGPLELAEILRIALQAAQGLAAAHAQGLVHRDVKPANMLLENGVERLLLSDFGLARAIDDATMTHSGVIAGTPQFMSPEQARGEPIDHRSDLFSLGSVMYAMATGRPPFRAETTLGILRRICDDVPRPIVEVNPDLPLWLDAIVARLLAKVPADRYDSAAEVAALLEQCLAHVRQPGALPLPESLRRVRPARTSSHAAGNSPSRGVYWVVWTQPWARAVAAVLLIAGSVAIGASLSSLWRSAHESDAANNVNSSTASGQAKQAVSQSATSNHPISPPLMWQGYIEPVLSELNHGLSSLEYAVEAAGSDVERSNLLEESKTPECLPLTESENRP